LTDLEAIPAAKYSTSATEQLFFDTHRRLHQSENCDGIVGEMAIYRQQSTLLTDI
jgi:hypothetical protein